MAIDFCTHPLIPPIHLLIPVFLLLPFVFLNVDFFLAIAFMYTISGRCRFSFGREMDSSSSTLS